jgi:hypothetical protein
MKAQVSSPLPDGLFTHFHANRGDFDYKLILSSTKQTRPTVLTAI